MAASPVCIDTLTVSNLRRRPLALTSRRLEANRRNAARSTGPRTAAGKARVARNPIKHGFFVSRERWTPTQQRDFEETLAGLREDFRPGSALEESCVSSIAESYVRMAAVWRYENIAALKYHQECERELNERIANADAPEAAHLRAGRDRLRRAGLWRPTLPGPGEATTILRYEASLNRTIHRAISDLQGLKNLRIGATSSLSKTQKQTHFEDSGIEKREPRSATSPIDENAKANPLSSMFTGNRHQRRRAKALAARRR